MKTRTPERHISPLPRDLRRHTQQHTIAQLLLLGWTITQIARKMHVTIRAIRYAINKPEFQQFFEQLQRERLKVVDLKMSRLLVEALKALRKQLKSDDWRCVDAAIQTIGPSTPPSKVATAAMLGREGVEVGQQAHRHEPIATGRARAGRPERCRCG
jgi:hypothetical protein